jgi:hypothetical protein
MSVRVAVSRKGFLEVDLRVRLPDGTRYRERVKAPVQSKSGAMRWGEERARFLMINGPTEPKKEEVHLSPAAKESAIALLNAPSAGGEKGESNTPN